MRCGRNYQVKSGSRGKTNGEAARPSLLAFQAQYIVRADAVVFAERAQVADGHFVDAVFIPGIDLLGGAEHTRDGALLQVPVLAEFAKNHPVILHGEYLISIVMNSIFTPDRAYGIIHHIWCISLVGRKGNYIMK